FTLDPKIDAGAFALTLPANEAEKEAEKLFRAMEAKINAAKAVQAAFDIEMKAKAGGEGKFKGSLLFTNDHKARLKMSGGMMGKEVVTIEMISDGKQVKLAESPETIAKVEAERAPKNLSHMLTTMVAGPGPYITFSGDLLCLHAPDLILTAGPM